MRYFIVLVWLATVRGDLSNESCEGEKEQFQMCNAQSGVEERGDTVGPNGCCTQRYDFLALLFNDDNYSNMTCLGAIITSRWILDNCMEDSGFSYNRIKVGWARDDSYAQIYGIEKRIRHPSYRNVPFTIKGYNTRDLYATSNAIFLHKTENYITPVYGHIRSIKPYYEKFLPSGGAAVYVYRQQPHFKCLCINRQHYCDEHFQRYFQRGQKVHLDDNQYCVPTSTRFTPDQCCRSQALMVYNHRLVGIMAWSTGCSDELGVDPWVFTNLIPYLDWIKFEIFRNGHAGDNANIFSPGRKYRRRAFRRKG